MTEFSHAFLLIFGQLAFGGVLALSVPGFHEIARGFFKSTACVYLACGIIMLLGKLNLNFYAEHSSLTNGAWVEVVWWAVFSFACSLYTYTLWGDNFALRARAYLFTLASGIAALTYSAQLYHGAPLFSFETIFYPLSFLTGAAMLGAVSCGMSLGHWYLIELDLSLEPFKRIFRFYAATIVVHLITVTVGVLLVAVIGKAETWESVTALWEAHEVLLLMRVCLGPIASLAVAWMIHRTLQIPQTMAATGLFYVAILAGLVGEFLGRFILFRVGLPI